MSDKVGPTRNDSPDLIKPLDLQKSSISHFLKPVDLKEEMNKNLATVDQKETNAEKKVCC